MFKKKKKIKDDYFGALSVSKVTNRKIKLLCFAYNAQWVELRMMIMVVLAAQLFHNKSQLTFFP